MRHGVKGRKLKRTASHRAATMNALATALLTHKRIKTTEAKAKETRTYVEPFITRAKRALALTGENAAAGVVHARREAFSHLRDDDAVKMLFNDIAPRVEGRAGGYTRVVKLGQRMGDNARMAIIELVDWNESGTKTPAKTTAAKPRPTRNKAKSAEALTAANEETSAAPKKPRATRKKKEDEAPKADAAKSADAKSAPKTSGEETSAE